MTLDEAIKYFEEMVEIGETYDVSKIVEENRQLLEWLKDYKRLLELQSCEDAISRQAVLDINENHHGRMPNHVNHQIWEEIKALPSVTPAGKQEPCEDVISRQAVIDAMYKLCDTGENLKENPWRDNPHIDTVVENIEELPPVTPQPKVGHWIFVDRAHEHAHCSECDYGNVDLLDGRPHKYCPNCGAKMVEPQERSERICLKQ